MLAGDLVFWKDEHLGTALASRLGMPLAVTTAEVLELVWGMESAVVSAVNWETKLVVVLVAPSAGVLVEHSESQWGVSSA